MSYYLFQMSYTESAIKAMVATPSDREAAARKLIESLGGKLHHLFFAFGKYDIVCLIENEDDTAMMAGTAVIGASGVASSMMTTKLMTSKDAMAAMKMASKAMASYKPPQN
jgi:uncharacterized protein with GYD domain